MDIQYHSYIKARGPFFAFVEDGGFLVVTCRLCAHRTVYGKHAEPLLIRADMDSHLRGTHPDQAAAIVLAPLSTPSTPPENPA